MITFTKKDMMDKLRKELNEYEAKVGDITPVERKGLYEWVASGNQAICNPWFMTEEDSSPIDYITAARIIEDIYRNLDDYFINLDTDSFVAENKLPF